MANTAPVYLPGCPVLCVDLDGTLLRTDTLWECLIAAWKKQPWLVFLLPLWILAGKSSLKKKLAELGRPDPAFLPYDQDLLEWLRSEHRAGRQIVLATGANELIAHDVADHLGIFSAVFSSNDSTNLVAEEKLSRLRAEYGDHGFEYIGDSRADIPIWRHLGCAHVVSRSRGLAGILERLGIAVTPCGSPRRVTLKTITRQLRVHQWSKNLLIFFPLFTAHKLTDTRLWEPAIATFFAFNFIASAFYIFNDLLDVRSDRVHPTKRNRPIAAGILSPAHALILLFSSLAVGLALAISVSPMVLAIAGVYLTTTCLYSLYTKRVLLVDIITLAGLYTIRVFAGGLATGIVISYWTMGYTSLLFLSLALMKRYSELLLPRGETLQSMYIPGRSYAPEDRPILANVGLSCGILAAVLLALYLRSPEVELLYRRPGMLMPLCILHIYWVARAWIIANRQKMNADPIVFALRDHVTRKLAVAAAIIVFLAQ
jgi:4-hydroxybenzoate polyprenyltransferase